MEFSDLRAAAPEEGDNQIRSLLADKAYGVGIALTLILVTAFTTPSVFGWGTGSNEDFLSPPVENFV